MSDHDPPDYTSFPSSHDQESDGKCLVGSSGANNYNMPLLISDDPLSLWCSPPFPSTLLQEAHETAEGDYSDILNDLSTAFEEAPLSPPPLRHADPIEIPCSEEIILHDSSGAKTKQASDSLEMQTQDKVHEDGGKEVRKQYTRKHSGEAYNLSNKMRRKRFNEKLKVLQELIPRCNKRDKDSTLDDAIKYIKNLQYQVQLLHQEQQTMGSTTTTTAGAGFPMSLNFPWMNSIMPQLSARQFPHNFPGTEYGMGMGMSYPMKQSGISNYPWNNDSLASTSSSGLLHASGGISEPAQINSNIANNTGNVNVFELPLPPGNSISYPGSQLTTTQGYSSQNATPEL